MNQETVEQHPKTGHDRDVTVVIHVNDKPVRMNEHRPTGMEIKEAAIAQGIPIQANFVLMKELGGGRTEVVGDGDRVAINKESKFVAIHPDDNS